MMLRNFKNISDKFLQCTELFAEAKRTTFILRRRMTPRLNKLGAVDKRKLKRRDYYYELVENRNTLKRNPVEVILLKPVIDVGIPGEIVEIHPIRAYEKFILTGAATYATPENIEKYSKLKTGEEVSSSLRSLFRTLNHQLVPVFMNGTEPWTLEPWHIKCNMRKHGLICKEDAIILPEKKIVGPDSSMDGKEFIVHIQINEHKRPVRCRFFFLYDVDGELCSSFSPDYYKEPSFPLFPEDEEMIKSLSQSGGKKRKFHIDTSNIDTSIQ